MESVECGDLGFENWDGDLPDCSSSGVLTHRPNETTELSCKPVNGSAGPFNALEENSGSRDFASNDDNYRGINIIPRLIGCQLDNALAQQLTRTTRAGTGSFSQNQMDRFMSSGGQLKDGFPESHVQSNNASSSNGKKRKQMFDDKYQLAQLKYHQRGEIDGEGSAEKQKQEQHLVSNMGCKLEGKTVDEFSNCKKDLKEDSIHIKAKRRQSLNNHSRAERIRREKISKRMKFLQDIVPGCSKIIGKSAMLDEIINYVLSLQQQIEFLSMKVATVYPEINLGIQQIPSRDANNNEINCSQDGNTTMLGGPRIDAYYTIQDEVSYRTFSANRNTNHLERAHTSGKHVEQRCPK